MISDPLDFIADVHRNEREICAVLDRLATGSATPTHDVNDALTFLQTDLPLHLRDEEEDLFPTLRVRCEPEDEIESVIHRLHADHAHAADDTPMIIDILKTAEPTDFTTLQRQHLANYATQARRHLTVENAIILPIARVRLTDADHDRIRTRMVARRWFSDDIPTQGEDKR